MSETATECDTNDMMSDITGTFSPVSATNSPASYCSASSGAVTPTGIVPERFQGLELSAVPFVEPQFWCSVSYYEYNRKFSDMFHASGVTLIIDGSTEKCTANRFSLGSVENANRDPIVVTVRKCIGRGLRLFYLHGDVFVECTGDNPIYIQSSGCNKRHNWNGDTVVKVPPGCNLKVFSHQEFARVLAHAVGEGYDSVFKLARLCTSRIGFVKGWGTNYQRQSVTSLPCWVEVHLNGPLQWLDLTLSRMGRPDAPCTSVS